MATIHKFAITINILDNHTKKTGQIFLESDDPTKLASSAANLIEASCGLINMEKEDLGEVQRLVAKKIKNMVK